jgi:hypothetical protein
MHRHAASNNYPMQVTAVNELTYRRRSSHRRRHHRAHGRPAPTWAACSNAVSSDARAHGPARSTSAAPRWPRRRERTFSACARAGRRLRAFSLSLSFAREVFDQSFLNVLLTSNHCTRWNFDVTSCSRRENFDVTSMVPWWRGAYGRVGESELLIDQYSVCSDFRADRNCSAAPQTVRTGAWIATWERPPGRFSRFPPRSGALDKKRKPGVRAQERHIQSPSGATATPTWRGARARARHPQPLTAPRPDHGEEEGGRRKEGAAMAIGMGPTMGRRKKEGG